MLEWALPEGGDSDSTRGGEDVQPGLLAHGGGTHRAARRRPRPSPWQRYHLNIWTGGEAPWILADEWDANAGEPVLDGPGFRVIGIDAAVARDTAALALVRRDPDDVYHAIWRVWEPTKRDKVPLADVEAVTGEWARRYKVDAVVYDPRFFEHAAQNLALFSTAAWPSLANALQDLWTTGNTTPPPASPGQLIGQTFAIRCSESPNPAPAAFPSLDAFAYQRAGPLGPWWSWQSVPCASWRATAADRYTGPWDRRTANPVLVLNTTHDPSTPYEGAVAMSQQLARARLLTVDGYGHGAQGAPSACVTHYITRYLIRTKLPPEGTRCGQDQQPFSPDP